MADERFVAKVVEDGGRRVARALFGRRERAADAGLSPGDVVLVGSGEQERLARAGTARAALYDLLVRHDIDPVHPPEVMAETARLLAAPGLDDGVEDTTHLPFVTIDNEGSRDLDQAMCIQRAPGGGWIVHYALADASYYVRPGTALFDEALRRGTSYYLPGFAVPMLPAALSEGLVSLNPQVDRRALTFVHHVTAEGAISRTEVHRARIRSRAQLTYDGVQRFHDAAGGHPMAGHDYTETLLLLREVGEALIARARARGMVVFERKSLEVVLEGEDGHRLRWELRGRNDVERWNEQLSLMCNTEGAALFLKGAGTEEVQPIFRVHPAPEPDRLRSLDRAIDDLVRAHRLDPAVWAWRRDREDLSAYLARLPLDPTTQRVRDGIQRQVLYTNQPSMFTSGAGPHHALGVSGYARFSAPMREIVGIFTHKEGLEQLGLRAPSEPAGADERTRAAAIQAGNLAKKRQSQLTKEVHKLAIDQLLAGDLSLPEAARPARAGTILSLDDRRLFVELDEFPIEIKVYVTDLEAVWGCRYTGSRDGTSLTPADPAAPTFRVGGGVALRTIAHDQGRWRLRPEPLATALPA